MGSPTFDGIILSKNSKTGDSLNVGLEDCQPTRFCRERCYARFRDSETGLPNTGPITWETQQEAYRRNSQRIRELAASGELDGTAAKMAGFLLGTGRGPLRGNGAGDLFPELCELYAWLAMHGVPIFLFSRKPDSIVELVGLCQDLGVDPSLWPWVIGSVDETTGERGVMKLMIATRMMNGQVTLALATAEGGKPVLPFSSLGFVPEVIFGYHSNFTKTVVDHPRACPATNGEKVKCSGCRRCYGKFVGWGR